jgi:hypothetical protein
VPNPFNRILLAGTAYADTATIQDVWAAQGGSFIIENGRAFYQLQYNLDATRKSGFGNFEWSPEALLPPGQGPIPPNATGVRFRNQDATLPATVSAVIANGPAPVLTLSSQGTIGSTMITGLIPAAGTTPTAGTGFTYTHTNGTGIYVFTFVTPFSTIAPVVLVTQTSNPVLTGTTVSAVESVTVNGFTVRLQNTAGAPADNSFNFIAQATV